MSEAELHTGAAILPAGKRRDSLTATIDIMITEDFAGRVLPFDSAAAKAYAAIAASPRAAGQPIMEADCRIGAIARVRGHPHVGFAGLVLIGHRSEIRMPRVR
ncbi:hypothetical protein Ms3S1_27920 [Methylosinus sp. 3S-1]|uniref:hypothetical protein n=1 Tax=Methylosinus trichosporium TaxID=426 RepID=UPI0012E9D170|nr:hypothetical protein [Methylosinus trichosporium]